MMARGVAAGGRAGTRGQRGAPVSYIHTDDMAAEKGRETRKRRKGEKREGERGRKDRRDKRYRKKEERDGKKVRERKKE